MRTISELLTILRDSAKVKNNKITWGLCYELYDMRKKDIISEKEYDKLYDYINDNVPVRKIYGCISPYGWTIGKWPPRLAWLNEHIEINKSKGQ